MIIVDHLGFIDAKPGTGLYETQAAVVKTVSDLAREKEVPVILVAHLRKKDRGKGAPLLADQEDFSGISNIFQIANTCIMLAPAGELARNPESAGHRLWDTFMAVRKSRVGGGDVTNATAVLQFDPRFNTYQANYAVGRLTDNDSHWTPTDRPAWATHGTISTILPTNPRARTKETTP